jgi:hypothetical protein
MSLNSKHLLVACIIALLVCCGTPAFAQLLSGTVVGVVQDSSGGAVSGALVTLTNVNTAQSLEAKTDDAGRYTLSNVSPGTYSLKVTQKGFKVETITDIQVSANTVTRVDRQLEVGSLAEQITVEASATELQTDKADTHTELGSKDVANMPLPGYRNYQTLMNLVQRNEPQQQHDPHRRRQQREPVAAAPCRLCHARRDGGHGEYHDVGRFCRTRHGWRRRHRGDHQVRNEHVPWQLV